MALKDTHVEGLEKRCLDLIDIAHLLTLSLDKDTIIKKALDHVHERLGKRARYAVLEDGHLVIRHWIGEYEGNFLDSKRVAKRSILWDVFTTGKGLNLTDSSQTNGHEHSLTEQVKIKAVVPLRYFDARTHQEVKFGVLVVDSGKEQDPITDEEFEYLQIMADLIAEAVGKTGLVRELIRSYEKREEASKSLAHFLRNRFMVIGGFSRRLLKKADNTEIKRYAETIAREIEEMERSLQALEEMLQGEEEQLQRVKPELALP